VRLEPARAVSSFHLSLRSPSSGTRSKVVATATRQTERLRERSSKRNVGRNPCSACRAAATTLEQGGIRLPDADPLIHLSSFFWSRNETTVILSALLLIAAACGTALPTRKAGFRTRLSRRYRSAPGSVGARGVQIYECRVKSGDSQATEWVFVAPEADLFAHGKVVGNTTQARSGKALTQQDRGGGKGARRCATGRDDSWLLLATKSVAGWLVCQGDQCSAS